MMASIEETGTVLRGPLQISVDFTNRCNLRCLHCFNRSGDEAFHDFGKELSNRELMVLADDVRELQPPSLCICGGEPLLRKDDVIAFLCAVGDVPTKVSMVSNGWFFDKEIAVSLKASGLAAIQFSVDGCDAATHDRMRGVAGSFKRVVSAITIAKEVGFESLSVAFSPTQFNFRQFANTVDCLVDLGVTNVRMQPLMGLGRGRQSQNIFMKPEEYRDLLRSVALLRAEYPDIRIEWGDPIDHLLRFAETPDCAPFLSISSIGNICLSPYLPIMLGNVRRHTLLDYWNGGIWKCWQIALFRDIVSFYTSAMDLSRTDVPAPNADFFESVGFDIIDDMIADLSFERMNVLYWNRFKECIAHSSRNGETFIGRCISLAQTHPRLAPSEIKRLVDGAARWPSRRYDAHMSLYSLQAGGLSYEICSESALRDIMCFLSKIKKQNLIEADGFDSIGYVSPNFDLDNIGVADLRMHIFNCSWIFFSVRSQRDGFVALGMVEVRNGFEKGRTLLSNAGVLQFLLVCGMNECETNDVIERLEKFIERNLRCASIIATPKLHVLVESADAVKSGIADILCRRNFFREVASGHDGMVLYSKFLP